MFFAKLTFLVFTDLYELAIFARMSAGKNFPLLLFWPGYFVYIGRGADTKVHAHHAIQVAIALETAIEIVTEEGQFIYRAVIINSDVPHECRTNGSSFLLINIDPETSIGTALKKDHLLESGIAELSFAKTGDYLRLLKPLLADHSNIDAIYQLTHNFLGSISHIHVSEPLDERIEQVLKLLREPVQEHISIKDLAGAVHISSGRLIHLFTEQIGIPIRRYILWSKLMASLKKLNKSANFTHVALEGGFADAPHFNRTFKKMFGLSPTALLKSDR